MKKLLLWLLMVALFVALLLGGVVGAAYFMTSESSLPEESVSFGGATLENSGYQWDVPILGGVLYKTYYQPANLTVQQLGDLGQERPELVLPEWVTVSEMTLTAPDGTVAYQGDGAGYADFVYTQNGQYTLSLTLRQQSTEKPARPLGWYLYQANFSVSFQPDATLSKSRASQGEVVALMLTGILDGGTPQGRDRPGHHLVPPDLRRVDGLHPHQLQHPGRRAHHSCHLRRRPDGPGADCGTDPVRHRARHRGRHTPRRRRGVPQRHLAAV